MQILSEYYSSASLLRIICVSNLCVDTPINPRGLIQIAKVWDDPEPIDGTLGNAGSTVLFIVPSSDSAGPTSPRLVQRDAHRNTWLTGRRDWTVTL